MSKVPKEFEEFAFADEHGIDLPCFDLEKLREYQKWKIYGDKSEDDKLQKRPTIPINNIDTKNLYNYEITFAKDLKHNDYFINNVVLMQVHVYENQERSYKYLWETDKNLKHIKNWKSQNFGKPIVILCSWGNDKPLEEGFEGGMDWIQLCEYLPVLVLKKNKVNLWRGS